MRLSEDSADQKASAIGRRNLLTLPVDQEAPAWSGDPDLTPRRVEDPELAAPVLHAYLFFIVDFRCGVGRRQDFDHQIGRAIQIAVGRNFFPVLAGDERHVRDTVFVLPDRTKTEFDLDNRRFTSSGGDATPASIVPATYQTR